MKSFLSATIVAFSITILATPAFSVVAASPEEIRPLQAGAGLPSVSVTTLEGKEVDLRQAAAEQPSLLVFYRGGWCMYCTAQLKELMDIEEPLLEMGYRILAVSTDRPEKLRESADKEGYSYTLLSDSRMNAARAFGIAFQVDAPLVELYKNEYGIDLEDASGETHHQLPVPAVYLADRNGVIRYAHVNPDYRERLDTGEILRLAGASRNRHATEKSHPNQQTK